MEQTLDKTQSNQTTNTSYKFLCFKNPAYNKHQKYISGYDCVKCNHIDDDFMREYHYWWRKKCQIKVFEIDKKVPEMFHEEILCKNLNINPLKWDIMFTIHDWSNDRTKEKPYRSWPRRLT